MFGDIKTNVTGLTFECKAILIDLVDMGINKNKPTDPDYYKLMVKAGNEIIECSAWYGVGFKEHFKDLSQALYKPYVFVFELQKSMTKTKFGSDLIYYKPKVIGVKAFNDNIKKEG